MKITLSKREQELFKKFGLTAEQHIYVDGAHFKIINRFGIKKIKRRLCVSVELELVYAEGLDTAVVQATAEFDGITYTSFGEVSSKNNKFIYPFSIAQKRAESRLILEIAQFYEEGFIGEDEIDEGIKVDQATEKRKNKSYDIAANMDKII